MVNEIIYFDSKRKLILPLMKVYPLHEIQTGRSKKLITEAET